MPKFMPKLVVSAGLLIGGVLFGGLPAPAIAGAGNPDVFVPDTAAPHGLLEFGDEFNKPIGPLSALINLHSLELGNTFNYSIKPLIGLTNLRILHLGSSFSKDIRVLENLINLEELELNDKYHDKIYDIKLPKNCKFDIF